MAITRYIDCWLRLIYVFPVLGTIDTSKKVVMYDIDLFDAPVETIKALKQAGKTVICYFR